MGIAGATYREGIAVSPDGAVYVTPTGAASITSGTLSGTTFSTTAPNTGVATVLYNGGIPFINLSSGSVAANGAISAITALNLVYPNAYCYFPANIVATVAAAGWYYCTFSTTTAGVAFLDTYTSGPATIPSSPTAVTDGKGAFTGVTTEVVGPTVTVPALTTKSVLRITAGVQDTNNANSKTTAVRLSGGAGTAFISYVSASVLDGGFIGSISNTGATGKQAGLISSIRGGSAGTGTIGTIDTSVSTSLVITLTKATATDNHVLLPPIVELIY